MLNLKDIQISLVSALFEAEMRMILMQIQSGFIDKFPLYCLSFFAF